MRTYCSTRITVDHFRGRGRGGFTLIEGLIASVVLALVVIAVTQAIVAGQMQTQHALHAQRGLMLAEEIAERVVALPYHDPTGASQPGPESGESGPAMFDNADDYHGLSESGETLLNLAGETYPGDFAMFRRAVTCQYTTVEVPGLGDPQPGLSVTVTVTDQRDQSWTLTRFIPEPEAP